MIFTSFGHLVFKPSMLSQLYSLWLSWHHLSACLQSQRSYLVYFVDLIFWHQKFSAQEDLLGSIQKLEIIRIYIQGLWMLALGGLGVQNPMFYNVRLWKKFHYSSSLWPMLFRKPILFYLKSLDFWKILLFYHQNKLYKLFT